MHIEEGDGDLCVIPAAIYRRVENGLGRFFERLNGISADTIAADMLDARKALRRYEIISRYVDLHGKRVLEVGSGYGTNLIVWATRFNVDMTGVEPEGEGFESTLSVSHDLCRLNGVDPDKIVASSGESLPFANESFDVIYSANVLEHTRHPDLVLDEALRVLRPGGILHFEMPNYLTPFEGHYMVLQPPILWRSLLPFWIGVICRRDAGFARTLRSEINPIWIRKMLRRLGAKHRIRLVSLGEEIFRERLRSVFCFESKTTESRIQSLINALGMLNVYDLMSRALIALQAHYPLYVTVVKERETTRN